MRSSLFLLFVGMLLVGPACQQDGGPSDPKVKKGEVQSTPAARPRAMGVSAQALKGSAALLVGQWKFDVDRYFRTHPKFKALGPAQAQAMRDRLSKPTVQITKDQIIVDRNGKKFVQSWKLLKVAGQRVLLQISDPKGKVQKVRFEFTDKNRVSARGPQMQMFLQRK